MVKNKCKEILKKLYNSILVLRAQFILKILIGENCEIRKACFCENVRIGRSCRLVGSYINRFTYLGDDVYLPKTKIGAFCSIASRTVLAAGNHPIDFVSTSPATYSVHANLGKRLVDKNYYTEEQVYVDEDEKFLCEIGNDVWVGTNVTIVCGKKAIKIGDGSVVAAGSVVTKSIPPYEIWGGVPAKCIRKRFDEETIIQLCQLRWWEKEEKWIEAHAHLFQNPSQFLDVIKHENMKCRKEDMS